MVWVKKCCCCHLKGGAITIAVVFLVLSVLGACGGAVGLGSVTQYDSLGQQSKTQNTEENAALSAMKKISTAGIVFYIITMITSILIFIPACMPDQRAQKWKLLLLPFVIWMSIYIVISIILVIITLVTANLKGSVGAIILSIIIFVLIIFLGVYCCVMIISYYQYLRDYTPDLGKAGYAAGTQVTIQSGK